MFDFVYFDDRGVLSTVASQPLPALSVACAPSCDFACPHGMQDYVANLETDSNILAACGGSRTDRLFGAYKNYVNCVLTETLGGASSSPKEG